MTDDIQKAIADKVRTLVLGTGDAAVEILRIEAGSFFLGSPPDEAGRKPDEGPVRKIRLTKPFYLGRVPITQRQYQSVTGKNPGKVKVPDLAMDQLTYADAIEFCKLFSHAVGATVALPTEAQWEYACRSGTTTRFWSGTTEQDLAKVGWYKGNSGSRVHEVGKLPGNPWGFCDMHGNVCEFCRDVLPPYRSIADADPVGRTSDKEGIMRGGAWMYPSEFCRCASRLLSDERFGGAGLRISLVT